MKKNLITVLSLLAVVGCQKALVNEPEQDNTPITVVASLGSGSTKTLMTDAGIGSDLKSSWLESDKLGVYGFRQDGKNLINIGNNSRFDSKGTGERVDFTLNNSDKKLNWIYQGSMHTFYAYYPYSETAGDDYTKVQFTIPSIQNQAGKGDLSHIAEYDLLYSTAESMWNGNNGTNVEKVIDFSFNHALSVLAISISSEFEGQRVSRIRYVFSDENEKLAVSKGTLNIGTGEINVEEGSNEVVLSVQPTVLLSAEPSTFYILGTPGHASKEFTVYATINGKEIELAKRTINPKGISVSAKSELSLSQTEEVVNDGYEDLSSIEAANTYLISKVGKYKFNAQLKGNGAIPAALSNAVASNDMAPKSALVLWYNCYYDGTVKDESPVFVNSVSVKDGYIYFSTPSTFVSGNVVIAAFAEEGVTYEGIEIDEKRNISNATMLWSWNIWAVKDYDMDSDAMTLGSYKIMGRNLGAIADGRDLNGNFEPVNAVGNFYQWGRKDPFPSFDNYDTYQPCDYTNLLLSVPTFTPIIALQINNQSNKKNVNGQMFGYAHKSDGSVDTNAALNFAPKSSFASSSDKLDVYLSYATKAPYMFIGGVNKVNGQLEYSNYNWYYKSDKDQTFKALWGDSDSGDDRVVVKSLYDPCPAGWRTMGKEVIDAFVSAFKAEGAASMASNLHGVLFNGSYFPFTGYGRNYTNMKVGQSKISGYETPVMFWNASACDANSGYWYPGRLELDAPANANVSSVVTSKKSNDRCGAQGLAVRCVKE